MVVRHDGNVQPPPAAGPERGRADVAQRMHAEQVEADRRGARAGWPAGTTNGATYQRSPRPMPKRWTVQFGTSDRVRLAAGQDDLEPHAVPAQPLEQLALVGLAARGRLGLTPQWGEQIDSALIAGDLHRVATMR